MYRFLKSSAGGFLGDLIKWNFEKFLVDKNGKVVERYPPTTSPLQIEVCCVIAIRIADLQSITDTIYEGPGCENIIVSALDFLYSRRTSKSL